jgi:hypothetical protein
VESSPTRDACLAPRQYRIGTRACPAPTPSPTYAPTWLGAPPACSSTPRRALLTAARRSPNRSDFALVCLLGLLGLRIFEATGTNIDDLGEEHGHRVLRVIGKGDKTALIPLPPAVSRALDQAIADRTAGPILLNTRGQRMDRHAATRRLHHLAQATGMRMPPLHPHMLRHTYVTTMQVRGVASGASFDGSCDRCALRDRVFRPAVASAGAAVRHARWPVVAYRGLHRLPRCVV